MSEKSISEQMVFIHLCSVLTFSSAGVSVGGGEK